MTINNEASVWEPREILQVNSDSTRIEEEFIASEGQSLFSLTKFAYTLNSGSLTVYKNGLFLTKGTDWSEVNDKAFSLVVPATLNDVVIAVGWIGLTGVQGSGEFVTLAKYSELRDFNAALNGITLVYVLGTAVPGDGGQGFFQYVDGQIPGYFVDDEGHTVVPSGGDGSAAWLYRYNSANTYDILRRESVSGIRWKVLSDPTGNKGGIFVFKPGYPVTEDTGRVISPDDPAEAAQGSWVRINPSNTVQAEWYGVMVDSGSQIDSLNAAVLSFIASGEDSGTLVLPPGNIEVSESWVIGDGSITQLSTLKSLTIVGAGGCGAIGGDDEPENTPPLTTIKYIGAVNPFFSVIEVYGPMEINLENLGIDANNAYGVCFRTWHCWNSHIRKVQMNNFTTIGSHHRAWINPTAGGQPIAKPAGEMVFDQVYIVAPDAEVLSKCMVIGEQSANFGEKIIEDITLRNCVLHANDAATAIGLGLHAVTRVSLQSTRIEGTDGMSISLDTPASGNLGPILPSDIMCYNSPLRGRVAATADYRPASNTGIGFFPYIISGVNTSYMPKFRGAWGITSSGQSFGHNQLSILNEDDPTEHYESPVVYIRDMTDVQATGVITPVVMYDHEIKAKKLAYQTADAFGLIDVYDRQLRINCSGFVANLLGTPVTYVFEITYGNQVIFKTLPISITNAPNRRPWAFTGTINCINDNSETQAAQGTLTIGQAEGTDLAEAAEIEFNLTQATKLLTVESQFTRQLTVTVTPSNDNVFCSWGSHMYTVELV